MQLAARGLWFASVAAGGRPSVGPISVASRRAAGRGMVGSRRASADAPAVGQRRGDDVSDRSERFFAWVWRLNGLLLLALAVAGALAALAVAINIAIFSARERPEEQLTKIAGTDLGARDLRLSDFRAIAGTQLLYAQLASPSEYVGVGSSGGSGAARNLLFFSTVTKRAHWLLPGNDQTISAYHFLLDPPSTRYGYDQGEAEKQDQVATALLLEIQDSSEEASPGSHSRRLAVASPDGRSLTKIADATDGLLGFHQASKDSVLVFYIAAGAARVLDLDPNARSVRSDGLLSTED
jgi:hypothetical protein